MVSYWAHILNLSYLDNIYNIYNTEFSLLQHSGGMKALGMVWYILTLPLMILMKLTVPDCRFKVFDNTVGVIFSFIMSIVWIAVLSHFLVEWATIFGCLVGISAPLMGLTLIAAGTR